MTHDQTKRIGISVGPTTAAAASRLVQLLQSQGHVVEPCEANELALESAIQNCQLAGVVDFTLTKLVNELFGSASKPTSQRLTAAATTGKPMVIVPGGCDIVVTEQGSRSITYKEVDRLAKDIAQKASASRGPVSIVVPTGSWSDNAQTDPELARVFAMSLQLWLSPAVRLTMVKCDLGSSELAARTAEELTCLISGE